MLDLKQQDFLHPSPWLTPFPSLSLSLLSYPWFPSRFKRRWLPYCDRSKNTTLMFKGIKNPLGSSGICYWLIVAMEASLLF